MFVTDFLRVFILRGCLVFQFSVYINLHQHVQLFIRLSHLMITHVSMCCVLLVVSCSILSVEQSLSTVLCFSHCSCIVIAPCHYRWGLSKRATVRSICSHCRWVCAKLCRGKYKLFYMLWKRHSSLPVLLKPDKRQLLLKQIKNLS